MSSGLVLLLSILVVQAENQRQWKSLGEDGLHDPDLPSMQLLQEPSEALAILPPDAVGNQVDWVEALSEEYISPRTNLYPSTEIRVLNLDIIMGNTGEMAMVRFPHKPHTEWLDCSNCHDKIFIEKVDANEINMFEILRGNYCGQCHGAVSFPLTECKRCHSVSRRTFTGKLGAQSTIDSTGGTDAPE